MDIDFAKYRERVEGFFNELPKIPGDIDVTCGINTCLSKAELVSIAKKWPNGVPEVLARLWTEASSQFKCQYTWTPLSDELDDLVDVLDAIGCDTTFTKSLIGGIDLRNATDVVPDEFGWADHFRNDRSDGGQSYHLWSNCALFYDFGNGDHLGLDPTVNSDDPPVAFLTHEEAASSYVCDSFSEFLVLWERASFIGYGELLDLLQLEDVPDWLSSDLRQLLSPR